MAPIKALRRYRRRWSIGAASMEHQQFLSETTYRDCTVKLPYQTVSVCIFNARKHWHAIALEVSVSFLLALLVPSNQDQPPGTLDHA